MRSRKAEIVRRVHALPTVKYDDAKRLTSFYGLVLFSALFQALDFSARLRKCFAHLGRARVFGLARVVLQLVVHVLLGFRKLRDRDYYADDPLVYRTLGVKRLPDVAISCARPSPSTPSSAPPTGRFGCISRSPTALAATFAQMSADTFLARLCAPVPPPRAHTVLYYGVLSAHHALRCAVVPCTDEPEPEPEPKQLSLFIPRGQLELPAITTLLHTQLRDAAPSRLPWMKLLARVFRIDISVCSRCSGPMRVTRAVATPEHIAAELRGARPPPRASALGHLLLFSAPTAAP